MDELFNKKKLIKLGSRFIKRKESIAVAESVTSGLLQFAFSNIPEAASFFQGGITAYNLAQKFRHLQVQPLHAQSVNCVSQRVANEMALHVCHLHSSEWGIGITGYASPVPDSNNKVFAFFAISYKGKIKAAGKLTPTLKEPPAIQLYYVRSILDRLATVLR